MKSSKLLLSILLCFLAVVLLCSCNKDNKLQIDDVLLKPAPTVTSTYGQDLAISDDGILKIKYSDNSRKDVKITLDMIDQSKFNKNSTEEQTLYVVFEGQKSKFTVTLYREIESISIETLPTILSKCANPFELDDKGILSIKYADGGNETKAITKEMFDLSKSDLNSDAEQSFYIVYQELETEFKATLEMPVEDNTGTTKAYRFEAEYAEYEGNTFVGVEDCVGIYRNDGSQEQCVKGLFQVTDGGHVRWIISSDKNCSAVGKLIISKHVPLDFSMYTTMKLNGVELKTDISFGEDERGNGGWWDFTVKQISAVLHLRKGENTIDLYTNDYAETGNSTGCGGFNINALDLETTGTLKWVNVDIEPVDPSVKTEDNNEEDNKEEKSTYRFEAELASSTGSIKIDTPPSKRASGNKSISMLNMKEGEKLNFEFNSNSENNFSLNIYINTVDSYNFEDIYKLYVNDTQVTVGATTATGWDGTMDGAYYTFNNAITVNNLLLKAGKNVICFEIVNPTSQYSNLDCIDITTTAKLTGIPFVFEAEDAILSEGVTTEDCDKASNYKNVSNFNKIGQKITFTFNSDVDCDNCTLGIDINLNDPITLSDFVKTTINGEEFNAGKS